MMTIDSGVDWDTEMEDEHDLLLVEELFEIVADDMDDHLEHWEQGRYSSGLEGHPDSKVHLTSWLPHRRHRLSTIREERAEDLVETTD